MTTKATPGDLGSTERLGPLPAPARRYFELGEADAPDRSPWINYYTEDQMRAYALAAADNERERCIVQVFQWAHDQKPGAKFSAPAAAERIVKLL